jgi:hypothetical protein
MLAVSLYPCGVSFEIFICLILGENGLLCEVYLLVIADTKHEIACLSSKIKKI